MDNQEIPIVWGADEKYVFYAFVVMHSILIKDIIFILSQQMIF